MSEGLALHKTTTTTERKLMKKNISWEHLTQSDVRRELRAATDAGTIDLLGISPGDFRTLVNGTPVDGIRLRAEDLRKIGVDMKYTHIDPRLIKPVQRA